MHWRGHALRLVDLVDYCHYMTPMCVLPPVPAEWPRATGARSGSAGWETNEPWLLTWLRENRDGPYWRAGSLRHVGYDRIQCPTMIVAGWADGYRNNTFRTVAALGEAGTPWRLLAGPWAHADPATAIPGPRIDLDHEMVAWWDRWLRGSAPDEWTDRADVFVRTSTGPGARPRGARGLLGARAVAGRRARVRDVRRSTGRARWPWSPTSASSAWIDCAGHLPWGLSGDQRDDDAHSLTWDWDAAAAAWSGSRWSGSGSRASAPGRVAVGEALRRLPRRHLGAGRARLARPGLPRRRPRRRRAGARARSTTSTLLLDACAYRPDPGHRLRLSVAGADWPNTIAPPAPVTLTVHGGSLELPLWPELGRRAAGVHARAPTPRPRTRRTSPGRPPATCSGAPPPARSARSRRTTSRTTAPPLEDYAGEVGVDRRTFAQWATAETTYRLTWPGVDVRVVSTLRVDIGADGYDVVIEADAFDGDEQVRPPGVARAPCRR